MEWTSNKWEDLVPTVRLNRPSGDTAGLAAVKETLGTEAKAEAARKDFCHGRPRGSGRGHNS